MFPVPALPACRPACLQKAESGHFALNCFGPRQIIGRLADDVSVSVSVSLNEIPHPHPHPQHHRFLCARRVVTARHPRPFSALAPPLPRCLAVPVPRYSTPRPRRLALSHCRLSCVLCPCLVSCADTPTTYDLPTAHPRVPGLSLWLGRSRFGCTPCATDAPASTSV
jgi:hypothetical protein